MAQFTVRNFDDNLYKQLKERAAVNQRSLEAEVRVALADSFARDTRRQEAIAWAQSLRESLPLPDKGIVAALREDRDRLSRRATKKTSKRKMARRP